MNSTVTARVEVELNLTINEGNIVRAAAARINAEQWGLSVVNVFFDGLRIALNAETETAPWLVYRGGSHVALIKDGERILLAVEGRPEPELPVAVSEAAQAMIDGTYDQKAGGETAAREAAEARNRVMGYLAAFTDREGRAYASAYAHWLDEVGEEGANAHLQGQTYGLTVSRRATIRKGVNFARKGRF